MRFKVTKYEHYIIRIIIIFLLLISYDSFWFGTSGIAIFTTIRNIFLMLLPLVLLVVNKPKISQKNGKILLFVILIVLFSSIINGNGVGAIALIISGMLLGLVFVNKYSATEFFSAFSDAILLIAAYSFLVWILVSLHFLPTSPISNMADVEMTTSCGCIFYPILANVAVRNSSFFREPGVYMILLNISLIFELFILTNKNRKIRVGLLIASLLSTISTAGIIICCIIMLVFCYKQKISFITWIIIFIVISTALSMEVLLGDYINEMFGKFETMTEYGSGFARYSSVVVPLNIFLDNPLFGCGFTQFPIEYEKTGYELFHRYIDSKGLATNTFLNIYAIFGIFFGVFMTCGLYQFCKLISRGSKFYALLFCLIYFLMFSNESMPYFSFLYIFFYYGFNRNSSYDFSKNKGTFCPAHNN